MNLFIVARGKCHLLLPKNHYCRKKPFTVAEKNIIAEKKPSAVGEKSNSLLLKNQKLPQKPFSVAEEAIDLLVKKSFPAVEEAIHCGRGS